MPNFTYVATRPSGEPVRGSLPAIDKTDVVQKLRSQGLFLVSCKMDEGQMPSPIAIPNVVAAAALRRPAGPKSFRDRLVDQVSNLNAYLQRVFTKDAKKGHLTLKELVIFTRQISISIKAGMSFVDALQGIEQHSKNPVLVHILRSLLNDILSGQKLQDAFSHHPTTFMQVYISLVTAGEAGGFIPEALDRAAEYLEKEISLRSKVQSAMIYPLIIAVVAFTVVTFMMTFVVPIFVQVFEETNGHLPMATRMLMVTSSFIRHGGFLTPFFLVGLGFWLRTVYRKNEKVKVWWDKKLLGIPLVGRLVTLAIIARFNRTLATLVDNGVPALQSIGIARQVVENRTIEAVINEIYASIQQGNGISAVMYRSKYFPPLVANMVATGEKTGELPVVLMKVADYYESEVEVALKNLLTMMEPLMIVIMAVIVGFIVAGLMLPTFEIANLL